MEKFSLNDLFISTNLTIERLFLMNFTFHLVCFLFLYLVFDSPSSGSPVTISFSFYNYHLFLIFTKNCFYHLALFIRRICYWFSIYFLHSVIIYHIMQSCKYNFERCFIFVKSGNIKYLYLYKLPVNRLLRPKFGYKKRAYWLVT